MILYYISRECIQNFKWAYCRFKKQLQLNVSLIFEIRKDRKCERLHVYSSLSLFLDADRNTSVAEGICKISVLLVFIQNNAKKYYWNSLSINATRGECLLNGARVHKYALHGLNNEDCAFPVSNKKEKKQVTTQLDSGFGFESNICSHQFVAIFRDTQTRN